MTGRSLRRFRLPLLGATLAVLAAMTSGCGKSSYDPATIGAECGLPEDQHDSFMVRLSPERPARVTIDVRFTSQERFAIERAIATWNNFGGTSTLRRGYFAVDYDSLGANDMPEARDDCDFDGDDDRFRVVLESGDGRWSALGLSSSNPGVTIRCRAGNRLVRQTVFINLDYTRADQLESVVLHELGHTIGLDHSCAPGGGSRRYVGCSQLGDEHPYRIAVMFPTLRVSGQLSGASEVKDHLRLNDRDRANCIYSVP